MGAKTAGADVIFANDISPNAVATYRRYQHLLALPGAEVKRGDIASIRAFPDCELLIGCYPCQSFSMGGRRDPESHKKSLLYMEFKRCLDQSNPFYFIAENVGGFAWLKKGRFLGEHLAAFETAGVGYNVNWSILNAKDYGVPADRKRVFIVGVRKDIGLRYSFPDPVYGPHGGRLPAWLSHGDAIESLGLGGDGEFYHRAKEPFSWWYLSRNRKRPWAAPSYTISGNWRHIPLHPASPVMHMVESNLSDGWKQRWEFTREFDHLEEHPNRPRLENPRRLTWRENAALQTFPKEFEPVGSLQSKYRQIGDAVPPLLMETIVRGIVNGSALA